MKKKISYIISHHSENALRDQNLKAVLSWINSIKIEKEIIVVEQHTSPHIKNICDGKSAKHIFAYNPSLFSKAWGYNIGTHESSYDYIIYIDSDCLCYREDMEKFIDLFIEGDYDAGSPNTFRYHYLSNEESSYVRNNVKNFIFDKPSESNKTVAFTGGMFMIKKSLMYDIKLWDEEFTGWGFEDLAVEKKIKRTEAKILRCKYPTFHLFHGGKNNDYWNGKNNNHKLLNERYDKKKSMVSYLENVNYETLGNKQKFSKA